MRRAALLLLALLTFGVLGVNAQACSVSAAPMSFPSYNAFSAMSSDTSAVITTTCTGLVFIGATYEVRLDGGQAGSILDRKMRRGASSHELDYQVYLNAAHTLVWGNGVQGSVYSDTMLLGVFSRTQTRTVYGRVPASQQVTAGNYTDTPIMTVVY